MRDADTAMYHAKGHGKARHELFDADMHARAIDRLGLESDLRDAVKRNDFDVHYQPIVSLGSRMCTGFEALVRWKRHGKAVSPVEFIPLRRSWANRAARRLGPSGGLPQFREVAAEFPLASLTASPSTCRRGSSCSRDSRTSSSRPFSPPE